MVMETKKISDLSLVSKFSFIQDSFEHFAEHVYDALCVYYKYINGTSVNEVLKRGEQATIENDDWFFKVNFVSGQIKFEQDGKVFSVYQLSYEALCIVLNTILKEVGYELD